MSTPVPSQGVPGPYWSDETCALYLGDCREILPALGVTADCIVADPPYGETSLAWDRWPDGWLDAAAGVTSSLWCFGSLRMFLERVGEFTGWRLSQDVIWEKHNGSGPTMPDRFQRVHEQVQHDLAELRPAPLHRRNLDDVELYVGAMFALAVVLAVLAFI